MGSCEHHIQLYRTAAECIICVASQHIHTLLLSRLDTFVTLGNVTEHAKVNKGTTRLIITMYSKHVLALLQQVALLTVQTNHNAIYIIHNTCSGFLTVDIDFAGIIVRENKVKVAFELTGSQLHSSAHPNMVVLLSPGSADIIVVIRTEGTLACFPCRSIKVGHFPSVCRFLAGILGFPLCLVRHRNNTLH